MLELKELTFSGIGRFVESQTIDFASLSNFVQVDGENRNTGGSSGSGKSTIFNALDWLLALNDLPSTVLQSRLTDNNITVSGEFLWDGKEVSITRSKKLRVVIDGKIVEGSGALAEEQIDQILGMPRKLFRKLLHKRQKEQGFFLEFTPQKMHEFLIDCLNLSEFRAHDESNDKKIKDLTAKKITKESFLSGQQIGLTTIESSIQSLGPAPKREVDQEMVARLKNNMDEAESNLKTVLATHIAARNLLEKERPQTHVTPFDRTELELQRKMESDFGLKLGRLVSDEKERQATVKTNITTKESELFKNGLTIKAGQEAKDKASQIAEEIKQIRANKCPTCNQEWLSGKDREAFLVQEIVKNLPLIRDADQAIQNRQSIEDALLALKTDLKPRIPEGALDLDKSMQDARFAMASEQKKEEAWIESQNSANKEKSEKFIKKLRELEELHSAEANQARGQLEISRRIFDATVAKFKNYEDAVTTWQVHYADLKLQEAEFTKIIDETKKEIEEITLDLVTAEDAKRAIKTYLSYSFDDALEAIGNRATEIIRCIPNMSCATVMFDGTKETKDGKVKEEVNAVISTDGEENIPIKSLSGGERSALDIAVDLAVIDFIETRSGKGCNIFILDEPFNGLGSVEIEMALEVIKNSNTNKKIIIVDHNETVKEMVQNRLVVVRDGLTSNIKGSADV